MFLYFLPQYRNILYYILISLYVCLHIHDRSHFGFGLKRLMVLPVITYKRNFAPLYMFLLDSIFPLKYGRRESIMFSNISFLALMGHWLKPSTPWWASQGSYELLNQNIPSPIFFFTYDWQANPIMGDRTLDNSHGRHHPTVGDKTLDASHRRRQEVPLDYKGHWSYQVQIISVVIEQSHFVYFIWIIWHCS